ncbi:hypothetical protein C0Q70_08031 [Pomacea canaliculata]|uniref:CARD domain-containing protein n=1 Tax=Pomacea canaliculata TaxID=400727 RepID=A0A2T7PGP1_POMCA|nr:hypothetical protein C0Q70_08031 [Pomacea canaliculata]
MRRFSLGFKKKGSFRPTSWKVSGLVVLLCVCLGERKGERIQYLSAWYEAHNDQRYPEDSKCTISTWLPRDLSECQCSAVTDKYDQGYKMLELLQKRGPKAFHKFVGILETDYDWLAELLKGAEVTEMSGHNTAEMPCRSQPTQEEDQTTAELPAMAASTQKTRKKIMSSAKQDALAKHSELIAKIVDVDTVLKTVKSSLSSDEKQDIKGLRSACMRMSVCNRDWPYKEQISARGSIVDNHVISRQSDAQPDYEI